MKKCILSLLCALGAWVASAQNSCDLSFGVHFDQENTEMTQQNMDYLKNVLQTAMTHGQRVVGLNDPQFGVVVRANVVEKYVLSGAPAKTVMNLSLTFYAGDVQNGTLLSSYSMDLNGVGNSEGKAFNNAIHKINPQNKNLVAFVSKMQDQVVEYYNRNYRAIIKKAETNAALRNYEEAIYQLMCIPACCSGYDEAMAQVRVVFKQYIDQQCNENLARARAAWMCGFNRENAEIASAFLAEIYPDAACYEDAMALVNEIKQHMGEEWAFTLKRWDDQVSIRSQQLGYAREIALAFAQNMPQQIIHLPY